MTETQVRPSEALTENTLAPKSKAALLLTARLSTSMLCGEAGACGWLVYDQREPYQPGPGPLDRWPFFVGFLSSRNTRESVHVHVHAPELYGVMQGLLRLFIWDGDDW